MQMQMPELPDRIVITILIAIMGHLAVTATGGWMLYQSALAHVDATAATTVERLTERIDANGERIDRNAELISRNGEQIAQLRERMAAVEVRVGSLEDVVRFFHPPEGAPQQDP